MNAASPLSAGSVFLLDSIGELASIYSLAAVAFVGGSLVAAGGHNPLEPAQFKVPVVMGPHYENFRAIVEQLRAKDAIRIVEPEELAATFTNLLQSRENSRLLGEQAFSVFTAEAGATARAVAALLAIVGAQV
jgi:3-deoxy-D-manno-octulosonic-acid transferase